jgi:hypothetical protein
VYLEHLRPFTKYNPTTTKFTEFTYAYEILKHPQNNLNAKNSGRIKIENEDFLIYDVPGDGQCFFHALSLAITGNLSESLVYRSLICSEIYNNFDFYEDQLTLKLREELIYSSLVKQMLFCPSLPCNQIFILLCKIIVATEILVLFAHWLP